MRLVVVACLVASIGCGDDGRGSVAPDGAAGAGSDASWVEDAGDNTDASTPGPDAAPVTVTVSTLQEVAPTPAAFVAFKDGDGGWQEADGVDGVYQLVIDSGAYVVVIGCVSADQVRILSFRALTSEVTSLVRGCSTAERPATVSGEVAGLKQGEGAGVLFSTGFGGATKIDPAYEAQLFPGPTDVLLYRSEDSSLRSCKVVRDLTVADGMTIDLDMTGAVDFQLSDLAVSGLLEGENAVSGASFRTVHGTGSDVALPGPDATTWVALPASFLGPTDRQLVYVSTYDGVNGSDRSVATFAGGADPVAVTLPAPLPEPTVSAIATSPHARLRVEVDWPDDPMFHIVSFSHAIDGDTSFRYWEQVTAGWLAGSGDDDLETLDLSGLEGWSADWSYDGSIVYWGVGVTSSQSSMAEVLDSGLLASWSLDVTGVERRDASQRGALQPWAARKARWRRAIDVA